MKRVLFFLFATVSVCSTVSLTVVTNIEPQPFTAQVKRLIEATDYLGVPFEARDRLTHAHCGPPGRWDLGVGSSVACHARVKARRVCTRTISRL